MSAQRLAEGLPFIDVRFASGSTRRFRYRAHHHHLLLACTVAAQQTIGFDGWSW
jgi:hypothetical protein